MFFFCFFFLTFTNEERTPHHTWGIFALKLLPKICLPNFLLNNFWLFLSGIIDIRVHPHLIQLDRNMKKSDISNLNKTSNFLPTLSLSLSLSHTHTHTHTQTLTHTHKYTHSFYRFKI
jgi:hypothetical protein